MSDSFITLDNLTIGYDSKNPVLSGISLSIARNTYTAILGANGSGKSTLLKTLIGLLPPLAGRVRIEAPQDVRANERGATALPKKASYLRAPVVFGYVPQSIAFDPLYPLTAFDVALMGVYGRVRPGHRIPKDERAFTRDCLGAAGANEFARQRFAELSGGQKQRVLIARALATRPHALVLDEPTAGVDAGATHALMEFISQLHEDRQLVILLVTHDLPLVREHAHQVLWLHQGRILQGAVAEVLTPEHLSAILETEIS